MTNSKHVVLGWVYPPKIVKKYINLVGEKVVEGEEKGCEKSLTQHTHTHPPQKRAPFPFAPPQQCGGLRQVGRRSSDYSSRDLQLATAE